MVTNRKPYTLTPDKMEGQIDLLRKGTRASVYACREVLSLDLDVTEAGVAKALHDAIHTYNQVQEKREPWWLLMRVTAAQVLLKALAGG